VRHSLRKEYRKFLDAIDAAVPAALGGHVILDNYGTHKTPLIHRWLVRHPRFHVPFTSTGTSWIHLVERWFATLTDKQRRRGVDRSTRDLETPILHYIDITNEHRQAVPDENRGRGLCERRPILPTNLQRRTLASTARAASLLATLKLDTSKWCSAPAS
jgi:hypothetical protein